MKSIADVNVLLPLLVQEHSAHAAAWRWWEQQENDSVGLCLLTKLGVLRLLTNPFVMRDKAVSAEQALAAWEILEQDPRCFFLNNEPANHENFFRQYAQSNPASPNIWTDSWLAALAQSLGYQLVSFDHDFQRFGLANLVLLKITR